MSINFSELESLAIDAQILRLGDVAKFSLLGEVLSVQLSFHDVYYAKLIEQLLSQRLAGVKIAVTGQVETKIVQNNLTPHPQIKNVIAVASGKGGVGKSSTSVNLALSLAKQGAQVGILDADIYGPSIPTMLGVFERPVSDDGKTMHPIRAKGLQMMSIGFLVEEDNAMIWRAPMAVSALTQLFNETTWQDLDYLIIDLPPGTGDIQLTLAQKIPVTGALIVSTPQDIALIDAKRALNMFEKVEINVLGLLENMASHVCRQCGHVEAIFGEDGARQMAEEHHLPYLGSIPLDGRIRASLDLGEPIVIAEPEDSISLAYGEVAQKLAIELAKRPTAKRNVFGKITVENKPH